MGAYMVRRLLSTIVVMAMVGLFVFLLLRLSPGDPAAIVAGDTATPENIANIRERLGLNDPLSAQFARWILGIARGDLGTSIFSDKPVMALISQRLEPTLSLSLVTIVHSVVIAVLAGVCAAWRAGGLGDRMLMGLSSLGFSVPVFVIGYFLIYWFAISLRWLPVQGYVSIEHGLWPWFSHLILPSIALGLGYLALIARITRASMLEVLSEDYMRTAAAKGASTSSMLLRHALKNAGVPILTVIGIGIAFLISGVVITETVFNIPGIGRLTVDAINNRDYPIIQGVLIVFSGAYIIINLIVDLSYTLIDPRIRY
ncbi:peptide/nickel transport system permease protein [Rhizobiales bacterium GAS113]|nr:peptide/nickel transport system permease protein [Rhizobiales bacterium GAS113]